MITTQESKLKMVKQDYDIILHYLNKNKGLLKEQKNASLLNNIEEAEIMEEGEFPWDTIRLNSKVIIRDTIARLNYTYTIVLPEHADHRKCKVSVFSPIGSALFGYKRGDDTYWETVKGKRYFTIMAVTQLNY